MKEDKRHEPVSDLELSLTLSQIHLALAQLRGRIWLSDIKKRGMIIGKLQNAELDIHKAADVLNEQYRRVA